MHLEPEQLDRVVRWRRWLEQTEKYADDKQRGTDKKEEPPDPVRQLHPPIDTPSGPPRLLVPQVAARIVSHRRRRRGDHPAENAMQVGTNGEATRADPHLAVTRLAIVTDQSDGWTADSRHLSECSRGRKTCHTDVVQPVDPPAVTQRGNAWPGTQRSADWHSRREFMSQRPTAFHLDAQQEVAPRPVRYRRWRSVLAAVVGVLLVAGVQSAEAGVQAQDRESVALQRIGRPSWKPVDVNVFSAPIGTASSEYAEFGTTIDDPLAGAESRPTPRPRCRTRSATWSLVPPRDFRWRGERRLRDRPLLHR